MSAWMAATATSGSPLRPHYEATIVDELGMSENAFGLPKGASAAVKCPGLLCRLKAHARKKSSPSLCSGKPPSKLHMEGRQRVCTETIMNMQAGPKAPGTRLISLSLANGGQKHTAHYLSVEFLQEVLPSQSTQRESQKLA